MGAAIPAVMMVGSAIQAYGAIANSHAAYTAAQMNAGLRERDALVALDQSYADADRLRRRSEQVKGEMQAKYGAAGVTSAGSPFDVLADSAAVARLDAETLKYRGHLRALGYRDEAGMYRSEAENALRQGNLQAASALLTGTGRAGATYVSGLRPMLGGPSA